MPPMRTGIGPLDRAADHRGGADDEHVDLARHQAGHAGGPAVEEGHAHVEAVAVEHAALLGDPGDRLRGDERRVGQPYGMESRSTLAGRSAAAPAEAAAGPVVGGAGARPAQVLGAQAPSASSKVTSRKGCGTTHMA